MCTSVCLLVDTGGSRGGWNPAMPPSRKKGGPAPLTPPSVSGVNPPQPLAVIRRMWDGKKAYGYRIWATPTPSTTAPASRRPWEGKMLLGTELGLHIPLLLPLPPLFALPGTKTNLWGTELGLRLPPPPRAALTNNGKRRKWQTPNYIVGNTDVHGANTRITY